MTHEQKNAYNLLKYYQEKLSFQQFKTLKGQIKAQDLAGFYKGLSKVLSQKRFRR